MASADGTDRADVRREALAHDVDALTEQRLQALLDNMPICIARFDAECRHAFVSPAVTRLFGLPAEHFIGKRLSETGAGGDEAQDARLEDMIGRVFADGRSNSAEVQWMTAEGERFFEILHVPERDEHGRVVSVLGIAHDISKRKMAEQALRENESFLHALLDAMPLPVFYKDRQGRYLGFNRAYEEFFGASRDQLVGKSVFDISPRELAEVYYAKDNELFEGGGVQRYESQVKSTRGDLRDVIFNKAVFTDSQGAAKGLIGAILDITERKRAEDELRASEARFRTFADHAMDAFFLHGEKGVVLDANRQACLSLGYTRDELIGMSSGNFDADLSPDFRNSFRARADKGEIVTFASRHRRKDGSVFPVEVRLRSLLDGERQLYISTARDISERERAEEDLHRLNRELRAISLCHQTLLRASDEQDLLDEICRIIVEEAGYRLAWVGYAEDDEAKTVRPVAWAGDDGAYLLNSHISWAEDSKYGQGPSGASIRSGRIKHIQDIATDQGMIPWSDRALALGYRTCVSLPLKDVDARVFGALLIYSSEPDAITPEEIRLMADLSHDLAFGISVLRDRSERQRADEALKDLNRELQAISRCHQTLLRAENEQALLDDICRIIVEDAGYRMSWVGYVEHDAAKGIRPVSWAGFDSGYIKDIDLTWDRDSPLGQGPSGLAVRYGDIVYAQDIATDARMEPWRERALRRGYRCSIAVPLKGKGGGVFGVLTIYSSEVNAISTDEMRLLGELAEDMAFGIDVLRTREDRRLAEEKYRTIFENSPLGIFRSTFEGRFVELNPAMAHMLGYDLPEAVMREIRDIGRQIYAEGYDRKKVVRAQLGVGSDATQYVNRYRRQDGSEFDATLYLKTVRNAEGDPIMFDGIVEDITERVQAEAERERLQAQLLQAQKMESVGRLAGGIAHDFNNMLAAIMGYAELAMQGVDPTHRLSVHLQEIHKAASRSADLTRQLLGFARKQPTLPAVLDLNATVEGMLMMLRRLIGEDIRLDWLPGQGLWPVKMDPSQIDQVLANLCVNARDAIGSVGSVTIETANASLTKAHCAKHLGIEPGDYVSLVVCDDGCGMDSETLDKVFEPFFTTKGLGQGTGLGLAMVYGIVKQNGGFIEIDSRPGQGTTVRIYLPPHQGEAGTTGGRDTRAMVSVQQGSETILLVEDEPVGLDMAKLMLEECGYRVLGASAPEDAIRLAEEHAGKIGLLLTDVVMPGMNGHALSTTLTSLYPGIRTLFMSGYPGNAIAQHGVLEQRLDFIQKPFTIEALAAKVREVLDGR